MRQKLVKIRSSLGVVLPPEIVDALKLEKGDPIDVDVKDETIVLVPGIRYFEDGKVTKRFERLAQDLMERHDAAYRKLAE